MGPMRFPLRATSHTRLRARDHYTSSTLIGGKRRSRSKFKLHTKLEGPMEGVCECEMDVKSTWIPMWHQMDHVSWSLGLFLKPPLGGRLNTKPGDHCTPNTHNRWFILVYHAWELAWIEIRWNSIWLRARSHMASHCTWGSMTTLHDFGGVLWRPLDTFFWALTISWSQLLARVWSGHSIHEQGDRPLVTDEPVVFEK